MKFKIYILVPSLSPAGPIKGAIALANQLVINNEVLLVSLKSGTGASTHIDSKVKLFCLHQFTANMLYKLKIYRSFLKEPAKNQVIVSISIGFSADLFNLFCKSLALTVSSVRGNLPVNYKLDYGKKGLLLAYFHLYLLRRFHLVIAMTKEMSSQIKRFIGREPEIIGNFIDEKALLPYLTTPNPFNKRIKFVFVGSLSERKCPLLLVDAVKKMRDAGHNVFLDMLGDGPLRAKIVFKIEAYGLSDVIKLHGQVGVPYKIVRNSSAFVLPSLSEGISRAAMEALFLGIPVVMRAVDGNQVLVKEGFNGAMFEGDDELMDAMLRAVNLRANNKQQNFLPNHCRQITQTSKFLKLLERSYVRS